MKKIRISVQVILYIGFIYLLFTTIYPIRDGLVNPFTRMSPLSGIVTAITGTFIKPLVPGIIILLLTAFMGRFFCSWICPMGTTLDLSSSCAGKTLNSPQKRNLTWIKYLILTIIILGAFFHFSMIHWFDPLTLIYRFYTFSVYPVVIHTLDFVQKYIPALSGVKLSHAEVSFGRAGMVFLGLITGLAVLNKYQKRFNCRNICPLGALLSLAGRFSMLQKTVSDKCVKCTKCVKDCRMGAIPTDPEKFRVQECIYCFDCVSICPTGAVSFKFEKPLHLSSLKETAESFISGKSIPDSEKSTGSGFSRRHFLGGAAAGVAIASISKTTSGKMSYSDRIIRPPGALPEEDFNIECIRCGECMKVCTTASLQPVFLEMGLPGLMTPHFSLKGGFCSPKCSMCQRVCPVGAIQPFTSKEKPYVKIGEAEIIREKCISWATEKNCRACEKLCPYGAVYRAEEGGKLKPFVDQNICTGCRLCETKCPAPGDSAILISNKGERRRRLMPGENWVNLKYHQ
jgi:polyferredoxin